MLVYRDRTFCDFKECQHYFACRIALDRIIEDAKKSELPIAIFTTKPGCYEDKEGENK